MELRRRAAAGRISELFGPVALSYDEEARRRAHLGGGVEAELPRLSETLRRALEAYSEGVNAYVASYARPWELVALGVRPEPWTPLDCLRVGRIISQNVTDSEGIEEFRYDAAERIGIGPLVRLVDAAADAPTLVPAYEAARAGGSPSSVEPQHPGGGSNAWAIAGSRTASGRPLLSNDPHLPPEMPGIWYAAHLTSRDGLDVAGLTLAGTPGVVIGHNGVVAWGLTMTQADDADLFVDTLEPVEERRETIRVKGAADVTIPVQVTRHGPIVRTVGEHQGLALSWAAADTPGSGAAFLAAARARDPRSLAEAWKLY